MPLQSTPSFDGRCVLYPSDAILRDYLAWRQVDTHINNQVRGHRGCATFHPLRQYNTCFWLLVKSGMSKQEASKTLQGTVTEQKNELMFSRFGVNYNDLPEQFRKVCNVVVDKQHVHYHAGQCACVAACDRNQDNQQRGGGGEAAAGAAGASRRHYS